MCLLLDAFLFHMHVCVSPNCGLNMLGLINSPHDPLNNTTSVLTHFHTLLNWTAGTTFCARMCLWKNIEICQSSAVCMCGIRKKHVIAYMGHTYCINVSKVSGKGAPSSLHFDVCVRTEHMCVLAGVNAWEWKRINMGISYIFSLNTCGAFLWKRKSILGGFQVEICRDQKLSIWLAEVLHTSGTSTEPEQRFVKGK